MVDKLDVMDQNVHDAFCVLEMEAERIIETINKSREKNFLDVKGIKLLLDYSDCINGWVNSLAIDFLTTDE